MQSTNGNESSTNDYKFLATCGKELTKQLSQLMIMLTQVKRKGKVP